MDSLIFSNEWNILFKVFTSVFPLSIHFIPLHSSVFLSISWIIRPHVLCASAQSDSALLSPCPGLWSHDEGGTHSHMSLLSTTRLLFHVTGTTSTAAGEKHNALPCAVLPTSNTERLRTSSGVYTGRNELRVGPMNWEVVKIVSKYTRL